MPDPTTFDIRLADAFERYFADAPTSVHAMAVAAAAATPNRRPRTRLPWRTVESMRPTMRVAMVALVVLLAFALGGVALIAGGAWPRSRVVVPQPSTSNRTPAPPQSTSTLPPNGLGTDRRVHDGTWIRWTSDDSLLLINGSTAVISRTDSEVLFNEWIAIGSGVFTLAAKDATDSCAVGISVDYVYRMGAGETSFRVFYPLAGAGQDPCSAREAAFVGSWTLVSPPSLTPTP